MKKSILITFLTILSSNFSYSSEFLLDKIKFATKLQANKFLTTEDDFTKSWSQFDIDSRLQKKNSSKTELFDFIKLQTKDWSKKEQKKVNSVFKSIGKSTTKNKLVINFPNEIYFIKTSGLEEGGADGYTRKNYIVLSENTLLKSTTKLKEIIIHELFHILTRSNPEFRKEMYEIIGFKLMNNVEYPNSLKNYRITNPDAPQVDSFITMNVNGKSKDCMMILYSKKDYKGGSFFEYVSIGFLSLTGENQKSVEYNNGKPVIYNFGEATNFFEKVGKNTQYIIHPEEILAENFVYTLLNKKGLPNAEIIAKIKSKLK